MKNNTADTVTHKGRNPTTAVIIYWATIKHRYPSRKKMSDELCVSRSVIRQKIYCLRNDEKLLKRVQKISPCCYSRLKKVRGSLVCSGCSKVVWESGESEDTMKMAKLMVFIECQKVMKSWKRKVEKIVSDARQKQRQLGVSKEAQNETEAYLRHRLKQIEPKLTDDRIREFNRITLNGLTDGLALP